MKRSGRRREIRLKRKLAIVLPSEKRTLEKTMLSTVRNVIQRQVKRSRDRRAYEMLLMSEDRLFADIGVSRDEVARCIRNSRYL
ncbi:hypothetical protein QW131_18070 [Roseibium salinum]|nr:hypothetical protein [Roseibium salinum]